MQDRVGLDGRSIGRHSSDYDYLDGPMMKLWACTCLNRLSNERPHVDKNWFLATNNSNGKYMTSALQSIVQPTDIGWHTGNGKKLSCSQACCLAQLCLAQLCLAAA